MNQANKKIVSYYQTLESRLGYTFLTWDTKHFGYYPTPKSKIHEKKAQQIMQDILAQNLHLKTTDTILDAGSGRGMVSVYLAQKYPLNKIIGIDLVPFEVKIATNKAKQLKMNKKVKYYIKDYSSTKFPNNYFNAIYTMETLVHSPNIVKTLKEFKRILKPKGRIVLFEYSRSYPKDFTPYEKTQFEIIVEGSAMHGLKSMFHDKWVEFIKLAGFTKIHEQEITQHILPSLYHFHNQAKYPYIIIKLLKFQKYFVNTTAGVEFYQLAKKGLVKYRIFTAIK